MSIDANGDYKSYRRQKLIKLFTLTDAHSAKTNLAVEVYRITSVLKTVRSCVSYKTCSKLASEQCTTVPVDPGWNFSSTSELH